MSDDVFIPLFAIGMPMFLAISIVAIKHRARHREMRHREQMRALDLGLPLSGDTRGPAVVCTAIGAGVPVAACFFATITTVSTHREEVGAIAWSVALLISAGGLIAGYRLAHRLFLANGPASAGRYAPTGAGLASKDVTDPDLYDVVGRRG